MLGTRQVQLLLVHLNCQQQQQKLGMVCQVVVLLSWII
jgi:hypothetical protein